MTFVSEKPKRGRPTINDGFLEGARRQWASLLEESRPEIGWRLLQIRKNPASTIEDVRKAFQPVKEKPHNPGLAQGFYRPTFKTATPAEVHRNRVQVGELQGELVHVQRKLADAERSVSEIDSALRTATAEQVSLVQHEIAQRKQMLLQLQNEFNLLTTQEKNLSIETSDQEAYVYASELLDFLHSHGRYAVNPVSVANALAGLPMMGWRQSHLRCSRMPLQQSRLHYLVLEVILDLWKRRQGESKEYLTEFFKTQLPKLPTKLDYTRTFLLESFYDLRLAIEECLQIKHEDGEVPYLLTSTLMRNNRSQKSTLEKMVAEQEKLT